MPQHDVRPSMSGLPDLLRRAVAIFATAIPVLTGAAGCAHHRYYGPSQAQLDQDLRRRAAFDLSCAQELTVTPLRAPNAVRLVTMQGVSGCGMKATYVLRGGPSLEWILNSPVPGRAEAAPTGRGGA